MGARRCECEDESEGYKREQIVLGTDYTGRPQDVSESAWRYYCLQMRRSIQDPQVQGYSLDPVARMLTGTVC
jgi:hypothetical protein